MLKMAAVPETPPMRPYSWQPAVVNTLKNVVEGCSYILGRIQGGECKRNKGRNKGREIGSHTLGQINNEGGIQGDSALMIINAQTRISLRLQKKYSCPVKAIEEFNT